VIIVITGMEDFSCRLFYSTKVMRVVAVIFILLFQSFLLQSQTQVLVELHKSSSLIIHGKTNIASFKLSQDGAKLLSKPLSLVAVQQQGKLFLSQNVLAIQVGSFTASNPMIVRDFLKLMKSDKYPVLKVQLDHFETTAMPVKDKPLYGDAYVNITIAEHTRQFKIPVSSYKNGELVVVSGKKKINIRDFGLEPPVEMLGMIKVSEWIEIDFNLKCKLTVENAFVTLQ